MSDREKAGLRGPVRECIEETTYNEFRYSTTTVYSADGRLLSRRNANPDGSEWVQTWTYDSAGRLTNTIFGKSGDTPKEIVYEYDGAGRVLTAKNPDLGEETRFSYDDDGRKTSVKTFDPSKKEDSKATGISATMATSALDASEAGYGVPRGGTLTTVFDESDRPADLQVRDAQGTLVSSIRRIYGAKGELLEEKSTTENPALLLFGNHPEMREQMSPPQLAALNKGLTSLLRGQGLFGRKYSYDDEGRLQEVQIRTFAFDQTSTMTYNDRGDIADTREVTFRNPAAQGGRSFSIDDDGNLVPANADTTPQAAAEPPQDVNIKYIYEYDGRNNWTQQTTARQSSPPSVRRRTIIYY